MKTLPAPVGISSIIRTVFLKSANAVSSINNRMPASLQDEMWSQKYLCAVRIRNNDRMHETLYRAPQR